jgi:hypothetical protein
MSYYFSKFDKYGFRTENSFARGLMGARAAVLGAAAEPGGKQHVRGCVCGVVWCGVVWCGVVWCGVCVCVCVVMPRRPASAPAMSLQEEPGRRGPTASQLQVTI